MNRLAQTRKLKALTLALDEERTKTRKLQAEFDLYRQHAQADVARIANQLREAMSARDALARSIDEIQRAAPKPDTLAMDLGTQAFHMLIQTNHALACLLTEKGERDGF